MKLSRIAFLFVLCLPLVFLSCKKDNGVGKYIVKVIALETDNTISDVNVFYKDKDGNEQKRRYYRDGRSFFSTDIIEANGFIKVYAFVEYNVFRKKDYNHKMGIKLSIFKVDNQGEKTEVASVRESAKGGFTIGESNFLYYGAGVEIPSYKKLVIDDIEKYGELIE